MGFLWRWENTALKVGKYRLGIGVKGGLLRKGYLTVEKGGKNGQRFEKLGAVLREVTEFPKSRDI
jgi:hypothetical protein